MKKILVLACIVSLFSCKNSTSNDETSIYADETVLIVNYQIENMTMDEHAELGSAVAPNFTSENVTGLLGKSFVGDAVFKSNRISPLRTTSNLIVFKI